jgi:hypothetical protein
MPVRILVVGAALATGLGLTACSSSSGGTATPVLPQSSAASVNLQSGSATQPPSAAGGGATPVAVPAGGNDFCSRVSAAAAGIEKLGDANVRDLKPYLGELRSLVAAAPAVIKPDVLVLEQIDEQVVNGDRHAQSQLSTPGTAAHLEHFLTWMKSNCPGVLQNLQTS